MSTEEIDAEMEFLEAALILEPRAPIVDVYARTLKLAADVLRESKRHLWSRNDERYQDSQAKLTKLYQEAYAKMVELSQEPQEQPRVAAR